MRTVLSTGHPALIFWGSQLVCLYNDAFRVSLGPEKHPGILGTGARDGFAEVWPVVGAEVEAVLSGAPATWHENRLVPIYRHGQLQDVYWTYSYSGIDDETAPGGIGGVLVLCNETTTQVESGKRIQSELGRLAQLFEEAPIFIAAVAGSDHRFELANPSYKRLVGGRDLVGKTVVEAFPEVVDQGYVDLLDTVYRTGQPYVASGARIVFSARDGGTLEPRRLDFVYQPTLDGAGHVNGIFVVGVDVTERLAAEEALAVSEEQLRLATQAGDVGLWDVDPLAGTLFWPASVRRMFGIFSDRAVTMEADFYAGIHPADFARTAAAYAEAIDPAARTVYDVEYRTVGKEDGVIRWVAAKGRGLFDETGRCTRVIGTAVDITARKRNEARLTELNETLEKRLDAYLAERKLLSDIVEEADTLIQAVDLDFRWIAVNRACADAFERLYGTRPRVGESMLDALRHQPEQMELVRGFWQRAMESEGFVDTQEFGESPALLRTYETRFRPLYDAIGKRRGAYQFAYDVTEQKRAERLLAQTEAELSHARRMEAVGLLTGGIAHDFNNLLQALSTKFELIRRRPDDSQRVADWAASGVDITRRGARLTAQLMTFSRKQTPDIRPLNLEELLAGMGDLLRTTAGPSVRILVECEPVWACADSTQLEMALLNLTANARDAMPDGGQLVIAISGQAKALPDMPQGLYCEIRVRDNGCGMAKEVVQRAFEPFFTTKEIGRGSGLGLSQVYSMAQRAGGTVQIESDGKSFTQVRIFLRQTKPAEAFEVRASDVSAQSAGDPSISLLVVDDDTEVRTAVVQSLISFGYQVFEAESGEDGLTVLASQPVDLMLIDYAMPGMSGATTARLARSQHGRLPIVFMSGFADVDAIRDALGQSASLLRKPFEIDELRRIVSLEAAKSHRQSP